MVTRKGCSRMKTEEKKKKNYVTIGEFLWRTGKKKGKNGCGMRREKRMVATLGLAVMLGATGCAGSDDTSGTSQKNVSEETGETDRGKDASEKPTETGGAADVRNGEDGADTLATQDGEWERETPIPAQEKESEKVAENGAEEPENKGQSAGTSEGKEHLGGKVQNPQTDGMTLAQTTLTDEEGMVTLLEVKDAKKIPVKFTADTKVEHWTIQGGGAGIDMRDAAVYELEEGMGVELEGYYEGETFVATRVIMEEYV